MTDNINTVTYGIAAGAVPLTERRFNTEATEPGGVFIYWAAGVTYPAGAQTVQDRSSWPGTPTTSARPSSP